MGTKREHDGLVEGDTRLKKHKPGVPGWLRDEDEAKVESRRYRDYHLFTSRKHCEDLIDSRKDRLITMPIYSFSVNILCQDNKGDFLPLELTIHSYSLKDGKSIEPLHIFIDPGDIPIGCHNISHDHMKKHRIGYPFETEHRPSYVRSDYKRIYKEMLTYTMDGERTLLLNNESELDQARGCIDWLYKKATMDGTTFPKPATWSIFLVVDFIAAMHNYIREKIQNLSGPKFALHYKLRSMLEKGSLDHHPGYVCEYHKDPEKETAWCTRSCAMRSLSNIEPFLEETFRLHEKSTTKTLPIKNE